MRVVRCGPATRRLHRASLGTRGQHAGGDRRQPTSALDPVEDGVLPRSRPVGEGLRRRARADQVPVAVRVVDPADRRPVLVGRAPVGNTPARGCPSGPTRAAASAAVCGALRSGLSSAATPPLHRGRSPPGSRSSRRRTGRAPPRSRSRSARPSACPRPGTTSSARGSRSRSAAWRRRPRSPRRPGDRAQVEDALVGDEAVAPGVQDRVVLAEPGARRSWRSGPRTFVARRGPSAPIIADVRPRDRQDAGRAVRRGADRPDAVRGPARGPAGASAGTARDAPRTATGPTPGPPPPCGMQNVLCRLRCDTSAPNGPGWRARRSAFRLAPST